MKNTFLIAVLSALCVCIAGCTKEKKHKDRGEAKEMFERICKLTREYTGKIADSPDSSTWVSACNEFEEKLDKINFSYPPDTDLLLTEGQNDTIHSLLLEYIMARDTRIHNILHPVAEVDSIVADSAAMTEPISAVAQVNASRNLDN